MPQNFKNMVYSADNTDIFHVQDRPKPFDGALDK